MAPVPVSISRCREDVLARLGSERFDLLVIGAGAIGSATAWAAARAGARVAVVDAHDLAGGTSSASSKLLHGGLRYLAMGDLRLVREAHHERWFNATVVAPHLVEPLPFVVPLAGSCLESARLRTGVALYGALSRWRDGHSGGVALAEAQRRAPGLAIDRLRGALVYHDHRTDDARLTLSALSAAAALGACVANHLEVVALPNAGGRIVGAKLRDQLSGATVEVQATTVVNATGPWVDRVRLLEDPQAAPSVRLAKGVHLLLDCDEPWSAAVTTPLPDGRVTFAIPWHGKLMLGTTDTPYDGDPALVAADAQDEHQILREAAISLLPETIRPDRIRARFAGLRVLPLGDSTTSGARRETVISRGRGGMLSVAGGKLTTWLHIGAQVAAEALPGFAAVPPGPVPSAVDPIGFAGELAGRFPTVSEAVRTRLMRRYGADAAAILTRAGGSPSYLAEAPELLTAEITHLVDHEWVVDADDAIRRTGLWINGPVSAPVRAELARLVAQQV